MLLFRKYLGFILVKCTNFRWAIQVSQSIGACSESASLYSLSAARFDLAATWSVYRQPALFYQQLCSVYQQHAAYRQVCIVYRQHPPFYW